MNVLIAYGIYMIIIGGLGIVSRYIVNLLNWQSASSFLNVFSGIGFGMLTVGFMAIICGSYLQMISKAKSQNPPFPLFLGSVLGAVISISLALYSIFLEQPGANGHELFIIGCRFISIMGLFASPLCLIKGYLRKIQQGREENSNETNI